MSPDYSGILVVSGEGEGMPAKFNANTFDLLQRIDIVMKEYVEGKDPKPDFNMSASYRSVKWDASEERYYISPHQFGCAIDFIEQKNDRKNKQAMTDWMMANQALLIKAGLWMERQEYTDGDYTDWCHLQSRQPGNNKYVFIP